MQFGHLYLRDSGFAFIYLQIKSGSDSSDSLSKSEYRNDGYMFEPIRSEDNIAGHVSRVLVMAAILRKRALTWHEHRPPLSPFRRALEG